MGKNKMVILMLVGLVAWFPGRMTWESRTNALDEADAARSRASDIELQISRARSADQDELRRRLDVVQQAMPSEIDYQLLISKLRITGAEAGVQINSATLSDPDATATPGADPTSVSVALAMSGSLSQVQRFIDLIIDSGWVATASSITLNFAEDGSVTASFPIDFYLWAPVSTGSLQ